MRWRAGIYTLLSSAPAVSALVGNRIEPKRLDQIDFDKITLPAITYERASTQYAMTMTGPSRLVTPRIQISIWGRDADECETVGDAVKARLNGFKGPAGVAEFGAIWIDNDMDDFETEPGLFRRIQDYFAQSYEEAA